MAKISRDSDVVELTGPPWFEYGQKVRVIKTIRNDGTFPGKDIGEVLVRKGDMGYVTSIGTFLQQFYIYGVDLIDYGYRVGLRGKELEKIETFVGATIET
ncbi:nitrogen fixation protein NifZ [Ferrovum sp.]|jgi:nitrogen fixation protein NifZ|uniref:nitrogen fixation protein NifZ n=1 Tax=Ferrovum sp. TaxID=2609467 RepID=UPI00261D5E73|nr:nitrogen fixation protein NifZ [Ferrovum sp.]